MSSKADLNILLVPYIVSNPNKFKFLEILGCDIVEFGISKQLSLKVLYKSHKQYCYIYNAFSEEKNIFDVRAIGNGVVELLFTIPACCNLLLNSIELGSNFISNSIIFDNIRFWKDKVFDVLYNKKPGMSEMTPPVIFFIHCFSLSNSRNIYAQIQSQTFVHKRD